MDQSKFNLPGALNNAPTAPPLDTPSSSAEKSASTSATLAQTAENLISLGMPNSENVTKPSATPDKPGANVLAMRMLCAFATQLERAGVAEWRQVKLKDGRSGWALFFSSANWRKDGNELVPTR